MNPFLDRSEPARVRRSWGQRLVLVLNLALIAVCLGVAGLLSYASDRASAINRVALDRSLTELGEVPSGARVINILLVGSDSSAALDPDDPIQLGRQGERFGDVIIVAHIDERTGSVALLSLPRDLWVPIAGTQREDRINRAFLVGGPATLIDTIEETFDIPVHHYVNVDFAGFQGLVEAVGSVDVSFDAPARDWNVNAVPKPRSQTGFIVEQAGCHSLGPEQALAYVRSRYYQTMNADGRWVTDPTSDLGRIQRQQDFLQRLMQKAIDLGARNPLVLADLIDAAVENVAIDQELTPSLLIDLSSTYRSFEPGDLQTYTYPASDGTVGANRVLIPHHDRAEGVVALFNGEPFDSPDTVEVSLHYDEALAVGLDGPTRLPAEVAPVADHLVATGFDLGPGTPAQVGPGLTIQHGPGGAQAADIVLAGLRAPGPVGPDGATDVRLIELPHLRGRNVVVTVGPGAVPAAPLDEADQAAPVIPNWPPSPVDNPAVGYGGPTTTEASAADSTAGDTGDEGKIEQEQPAPAGPTIVGEVALEAASTGLSPVGCG
ncbi:MAG: LCP family protein [Acidimicrobiia bacterium]|nr:LCP family protein [Acidimicrobiia bacterium]